MKKIVLGALLLAVLGVASFTGTRAFFSDTETSANNVFAAGSMNLKVGIDSDSKNFTPRDLENRTMFDFRGLMPGDVGNGDILLSSTQDAWVCMAGDIDADADGMADYIELATWVDGNGNGTVNSSEHAGFTAMSLADWADSTSWPVQDSVVGQSPVGTNYNQGFAYCFGKFVRDEANGVGPHNLVLSGGNTGLPVCDGKDVSNDLQGASLTGSLYFYAEQAKNNPGFQCSSVSTAPEAPNFVLVQNYADQNGQEQPSGSGDAFQPYITWTNNGSDITFYFHNPTNKLVVFEYRVDGAAGVNRVIDGEDYTNKDIGEGPLAGQKWGPTYNRVEINGPGTQSVTITGDESIEVGTREGAEQHWYIDWIRFENQN